MKLYAGIDLHSNNGYYGIVDETGKRVFKKRLPNNVKNGNRYLAWAYVEAAHFIQRTLPEAKSYYQRKVARTKECVAIKSLASKLSKACYFIMKEQVDFDKTRLFG